MLAKKSLELNPHHPVMKKLLEELKESDGVLSEASTEYADLLFQMAIINSGFLVDNPMDLTEPLEKLIKVGFGLSRDEEVEEIDVVIDDEEDDEEDDEGDDEDDYEDDVEEIDLGSLDVDEVMDEL